MSRNMRAVRVTWGPAASVFMCPDWFEQLAEMLLGYRHCFTYGMNEADQVYKFWTENGARFLDKVKSCKPERVARKLVPSLRRLYLEEGCYPELREDAVQCLKNLKAIEPQWRRFLDKDGHLTVWVDAF